MTLFDQRPIRPMLAKTGKAFDDENYVFEPKWDGLRAILFFRAKKLELQNRNLRDATGSYPELQKVKDNIRAKTAVIDGEVVVLGENGAPNFGRLQARFGVDDPKRVSVLAKTTPVTYVAFDLLHIDGQDVISRPLVERKTRLKSIVEEGPYLLYGEHVEAEGSRFFKEATKRGFEGAIGKESQSQYVLGLRTDYWIKIKQINTFHITQLAYLLEKMKSIREPHGTLLDNSMIVYGAGIGDGNRHNHDDLPILLAGGLTSANVADAIGTVQPWGVDVASGVERAPGMKDSAKMREFIQAAKGTING